MGLSPRAVDRLAALIAALLPLAYFYPAVIGNFVLAVDDGLLQQLPERVMAARLLRDGSLPLWTPYLYGGVPLLGGTQAAVFFPLNWPFLVVSPESAMNAAVIGAFAAAGLGAFLYARATGSSTAGAMLTALVWPFGGFLVAHIEHLAMIHVAAVMPWGLWAIERYLATGRRRWGAAAILSISLLGFAAHPQAFAYAGMLVGIYAIASSVSRPLADRRGRWLLVLVVAGVALSAVQWLPVLEMARQSTRSSLSYERFAEYSLTPSFTRTFLAPFVFGGGRAGLFQAPYAGPSSYEELIGYVGIAPLWLAVAAPFLRRDWHTRFWTFAAIAAGILALGGNLPFELGHVLFRLPVLNLFRASGRHVMEIDFALAVLAGRALSAVAADRRSRVRGTVAIGSAWIATCLVVSVLRPAEFPLSTSWFKAPELLVPPIVAGISAASLSGLVARRKGAVVITVVVAALDLTLWGHSTWWLLSPRRGNAVFSEPEAISFIRQRQGSEEPFRVLTLHGPFDPPQVLSTAGQVAAGFVAAVQANVPMMYGLENLSGYESLGLDRHMRMIPMSPHGRLLQPRSTLSMGRELDLSNVRFVLSPTPERSGIRLDSVAPDDPGPVGRWQLVGRFRDTVVHENRMVLPRAWIVAETRTMSDEQMLDVIHTGRLPDGSLWEPQRMALVHEPLGSGATESLAGATTRVTRASANRIEIDASTPTPALLVISETFYPGWEARVDGIPADIHRVDYDLRGVIVPPGTRRVTLQYRPWSVAFGLLLAMAAVGAVAGSTRVRDVRID